MLAARLVQALGGFVDATGLEQDVGLAQLRREEVIARADLGVLVEGTRGVLLFLGEAAEVEVGGVDVAVALDQFFQVDPGFVPGLGFQADQRQGETQVVVVGELLDQSGELGLGVVQAVLLHQQARVGEAHALVVRVFLDPGLEQRQGLVAALHALQQARAEQQGGHFVAACGVVLEQGQGFVRAAVLLQQQGLAEQQLAVVRVFLQQVVEALQQAGAGIRVGLRGRQGEEVEVRVALAVEDLLHVHHGLLVAPGAGQLDRGGALGIEVVRRAARPEQGGVEGFLVGAEVFGDAEGALGNPGVAGFLRLHHIVAQGDVEAVALPGQFGHQQRIQAVLAEGAVLFRLGLGLDRGVFHRRGAIGSLVDK